MCVCICHLKRSTLRRSGTGNSGSLHDAFCTQYEVYPAVYLEGYPRIPKPGSRGPESGIRNPTIPATPTYES